MLEEEQPLFHGKSWGDFWVEGVGGGGAVGRREGSSRVVSG